MKAQKREIAMRIEDWKRWCVLHNASTRIGQFGDTVVVSVRSKRKNGSIISAFAAHSNVEMALEIAAQRIESRIVDPRCEVTCAAN